MKDFEAFCCPIPYYGHYEEERIRPQKPKVIKYFYGEYYSGYWEINYTGKIEIDADSLCYLENAEFIEVIGNVYDDPKLLEENNNG